MKKIIMVSLLPLSFLLAGNFNIGSFDILNGGYNQNTDIEEEHQSSAIDTMRSTGGEPYSMSSPTSMSTVDGGDVSSGGGSVVVSTGASGIEFYSTGDVHVHYRAGNGGKHTKMSFRPNNTSELYIATENQNHDEPAKTIEFVASSNQFVQKYTGSNPKVFADYANSIWGGTTASHWYQTAYVSNGRLNIHAGYRPNGNGAWQSAIAWLSVDLATKAVKSSGIVTSPNGKLKQGITVNTSTKEICFVTNLYSIYSFTSSSYVDGYFDKNNVTNCMKYLFR